MISSRKIEKKKRRAINKLEISMELQECLREDFIYPLASRYVARLPQFELYCWS